MSRRKATPPPVPDKPHHTDPPAAVQAEALTLRTLRDSELCASLPGRTTELLRHGDAPSGRYVLIDEATGGAQTEELWDRLDEANETNYALLRRLSQAHQTVCLAESNGDLVLRDVQRLVQEQWGWGIAGLRHASTWLQSEYGLTAEQADTLPLPELRARLRAKSAGASGGTTGERATESEAGDLPWEGDDWDDLMPQTRRLLRHMHDREYDRIANFAEVVWERPYEKVSDRAINTAVSRANHFLSKRGHKRLLSKVRGEPVVRWV
jgi:hypothetical protein